VLGTRGAAPTPAPLRVGRSGAHAAGTAAAASTRRACRAPPLAVWAASAPDRTGLTHALIAAGAGEAARGDNGVSPLAADVRDSHDGTVGALLAASAPVGGAATGGMRPLRIAADVGRATMGGALRDTLADGTRTPKRVAHGAPRDGGGRPRRHCAVAPRGGRFGRPAGPHRHDDAAPDGRAGDGRATHRGGTAGAGRAAAAGGVGADSVRTEV